MIDLLFSNPIFFLIFGVSLVIAITIHEFAHAWVADYLGDPTPRLQDRVTLNPLAHLDPMGTLAMLFIGFGWGKAVEFDPYNLKDPKKDTLMIAAAGPAINLALAGIISLVVKFGVGENVLVTSIFVLVARLNISLAIFNLIPVHPLDGSKILMGLLPDDRAEVYEAFLHRYGFMALIFLLLPIGPGGNSIVGMTVSPVVDFIFRFLF